MGRAPIAGAPQRVSAHVVPKAASYAQPGRADPEDEKTTIESGWEDEASTTVEQGEVAEKIRALAPVLEARRKEAAAPDSADTPLRKGGTGITSTNGSIISDELTVDDQRANAVISMIMPPSNGRLVVTMGNDKDTELEVRPGKSYTIGRGLDNDIVLTDIAVSRKHFDLRHEAGAWVLVDRGSGNGTLVNGVFEDQPFVLANGDTIEIGNTSFRFDMQGARQAPEPVRPSATEGLDVNFDDEENEPSTVAGKVPIRGEDIPTPVIVSKSAAVPAQRPRTERPKTAPPPPPLPRPRTQSNAPSMSAVYSAQHAVPSTPVGASAVMASMSAPMGSMSVSITPPTAGMPASTMPLPQMAGRMPIGHGSGMGPAVEPLVIGSPPLNTTLPGQGMHQYQPNGLAPHSAAMAPTLIPPPGTPMGSVPPAPMSQPYDYYGNGTNGGGYGAPPPGSNPMFQQPPPNGNGMQGMWGQPHPMGHMGHQSGIEIAPGMVGRDATTTGLVPPGSYAPIAYGTPHQGTPTLSRRAKLMLGGALLSVVAALATVAIIKSTSKGKDSTATADTKPETKADTKPVAKDEPKKSDKPPVAPPTKAQPQTAVTPTKATPPSKPQTAVTSPAATPPGKPTTPTIATAPPAAKTATPPVVAPPPVKPTTAPPPAVKPPVTVAVAPPPEDKPGKETKAEKKRREKAEQAEKARIAKEKRDKERKERRERERKEQVEQVSIELKPMEPPPSPSGVTAAKDKAEDLYKKKKFSEAAATIKSAAKSDASLKKLFTAYEQVGNAYKTGMASGAKPVDAYRSLKRARSFDATAGGYHEDEINAKLRDVAPRAAVTFLGSKDYAESYGAMNLAESIGVKSDSLKLVRNKLEAAAGQLYGEAESLMASDPDEAKKKLRVIKTMVSADSQWSAKATKLLRS